MKYTALQAVNIVNCNNHIRLDIRIVNVDAFHFARVR